MSTSFLRHVAYMHVSDGIYVCFLIIMYIMYVSSIDRKLICDVIYNNFTSCLDVQVGAWHKAELDSKELC